MSVRAFRRFLVTAVVVSLVVLPLSSAQAAPADRVVRDLDRTVSQALHKLVSAFRLFGQDAPKGNHPGNNHPGSSHPKGGPQEGTGIDPHGKPGQGN